MQKKPPILLLAVVLGVVAVGGTALLFSRGAQPTAPAPGAGTVVAAPTATPLPEIRYIANRDIPPRSMITSDMMRRSAISGPMPVGAITSLDDVRGMITKNPIRSGDTVTRDSFIEPIGRAIPANFSIPTGFRAVAISVDPRQTAAGLVDVGDRVDVIVTQKITIDKGPNQFIVGAKDFTAGRTIGTDLLVLAVDESLNAPVPTPTPVPGAPSAAGAVPAGGLPADAAPPPGDGAPPEIRPANNTEGKPEGNVRVILAAPLEIASRLVAANDSGLLHVVLRNPLDGDAELAPETREYPSRTFTISPPGPKPASGGGGGGRSGNGGGSRDRSFAVPDLPDVTVRQTSTGSPMPMPIQASAPVAVDKGGMSGASAESSMRDVMVVRGTEKTRVLVPKR